MVNYLIVSLSDLYDVAKEKVENSFLRFSCREKDIEDFLKYKAVDYEHLGRGKTFLVLNEDYLDKGELEIIAFFTTAITSIDLSELSKNKRKKILGGHPNHLNIPAFLIGQIGRCDRYTSEEFQGETLLKECCTTLKRAQDIIGLKNVVVECKKELIEFYQNHGFGLVSVEPDVNGHFMLLSRL